MTKFRHAQRADADRCFEIETSAYEGDEAATHSKICKRIETYPEGFFVLEVEGRIVGFINSGCAHLVKMSDEDLKELVGHDPEAPNVVIMSVVIDPTEQGKGYSRLLMQEFVQRMQQMGKTTLYLMCKAHYVPLYEKLGFTYLRPSDSDHGGMAWHEMSMRL